MPPIKNKELVLPDGTVAIINMDGNLEHRDKSKIDTRTNQIFAESCSTKC